MASDVREGNPPSSWLRSSRCTPNKNCVEVRRVDAGVIIRDSKSRATLRTLGDHPWATFLARCRAGDLPMITA